MTRKIAIVQSNYIPWKGYFDLINLVDEFVLYDDTQYTRRDWRNRNVIKTARGLMWLSIPVKVKGKYVQAIKDTEVTDSSWRQNHWRAIVHNYAKARYFADFKDLFEELYLSSVETNLSQINFEFLTAICRLLDITTKISWSMNYSLGEGKTEKLVALCQQAGAAEYVSGPSAKAYIDERLLNEAGIELTFMDYSGYPEYRQLYPPFEHGVSIIDLIFNEGPDAKKYMKSF